MNVPPRWKRHSIGWRCPHYGAVWEAGGQWWGHAYGVESFKGGFEDERSARE